MNVSKKNLLAPKQNEQLPNLIINSKSETMLVDAKLLHQKLGVQTKFATWIERRIEEYGFVEGQDFIASQNWEAKKGRGGHNQINYHLTMDTAKELAMVERTEQGRLVRQYFIEAEKELRGKRLYGQKLNLSELKRQVPTAKINGHVMLSAREARGLLGYNTRGSLTYWRNKYPGLIINYNDRLMASEEVVELWMLKATLVGKAEYAKTLNDTKPVLGHNFGQIPLNF